MMILALLLQTAAPAPAVAAGDGGRFSILVPVADQPCARRAEDEILVCADALPSQALPLPMAAVSPRAGPVNRDLTGTGALAASATPCAARVGGCQVGVDTFGMGTAAVRLVQKLVAPGSCCEAPGEATSAGMLVRDMAHGVGGLFRGKPDKSGRVAIPLGAIDTTGRVLP